MATEEVYFGRWKIVECVSLTGTVETTGIEGTEFILDESGDVSWKVAEEAEPLPFFNCETYEIHNNPKTSTLKFYGTFAGHVIEFKVEVSDDLMLLTYERCCMLQCQKVSSEDPKDDVPFSLLGALEEGYFTDLLIKAQTGHEFRAHSIVLGLSAPTLDWHRSPPPLSGLPKEVIHTTLHYMYAECLPRGLSEETAKACIKSLSKFPEFSKFVQLCETFVKNTAFKQQIISLISDMHSCADKIIELFTGGSSLDDVPDRTMLDNPAKLCYVLKQAIREAAVALSKMLILCDLFSRRKGELSREERHDIIKYAKSRIPVFMKQLEKFLELCKSHTTAVQPDQRREIAAYLVPEIESSLDFVSKFASDSKVALEQVISGSEKEKPTEKGEKSKKGNVGDVLGRTLKSALHMRELKKLKQLHDRSATNFFHFMQKKESFSCMSQGKKVSTVNKQLDQLIEEVPICLAKTQDLMRVVDTKLTWREWKYLFKLGTSKVAWGLGKVLSNGQTLQPLLKQVCDTVHRDAFTSSLTSVGLLDQDSSSSVQSSTATGATANLSCPRTKYVQLSSVVSLCVPPPARDSVLASRAGHLLKSADNTDMIFEIVITQDLGDTVIDHTGGSPIERTESDRDVEIYQVPAHCVVIAARCDWFRRALLSGMRESIDKKITVHDTNPDLFRLFLEYLYSGQLDMSELSVEQLSDMMTLADRYDTTPLKSLCECNLKHHVDEESALYLLSLADQLHAKTLKEVTLNFIVEHPVLAESEVFQDLPEHLQMEVETCLIPGLDASGRNLSGHSNTETPSSVSSVSEMEEMLSHMDVRTHHDLGASNSSENLQHVIEDEERLENCIGVLREVLGDAVPREELVQLVLGADYDINRALNFYLFSSEHWASV